MILACLLLWWNRSFCEMETVENPWPNIDMDRKSSKTVSNIDTGTETIMVPKR